ncbi:MAG: hypothetical protein ISR73_10745 [Gammaproteobacteria bacterium]|nr:hypothetical protein [Gammaproteobacteria bacterium]
MQPPPYALQKYRLEKLKALPPAGNPPAKSKQEQQWVLSSILYSTQRRHAIINNQLVRQGEMVQGARLIRLTPDSARLRVKGKVIELTLLNKKTKSNYKTFHKSHHENKI